MKNILRLDRTKAYLNMPVNATSDVDIMVDYYINEEFIKQISIPKGTSCIFKSFIKSGRHSLCYYEREEQVTIAIEVENAICLGSSVIKKRYVFDEDNVIFIQRADRLEIFDINKGQYIYSQIGLCPEEISRVSDNIYEFKSQEKYISFFSIEELKNIDEIVVDKLIFDGNQLVVYQIQDTVYTYDKSTLEAETCFTFSSCLNTAWVNDMTLLSYDVNNFISVNLLDMHMYKISLDDIVCICQDGCIIKYINNEFWYLNGLSTRTNTDFIKLKITIPDVDKLSFDANYSRSIDNGRVLKDELASLEENNQFDEQIEVKEIKYSFKNITENGNIVFYQYDTIGKGFFQRLKDDKIEARYSYSYSKSLHLLHTTLQNFDDYIILTNGNCLYYKRGYQPEKPGSIYMVKSDGLYYQYGSKEIKLTTSPDDKVQFKNGNCIVVSTETQERVIIYDIEHNYVQWFDGYNYLSKGEGGFFLSRTKEKRTYLERFNSDGDTIAVIRPYGHSYSQFLDRIYKVTSIRFFPEGTVIERNGGRYIETLNKKYSVPEGQILKISSNVKFVVLEIDGITRLFNLELQEFVPYEEFNEYYDYSEMSPSGRYIMYRKNQNYYIHDFETDRDELFETDRFIEFSSDDSLIFTGKNNQIYRRALINNLDSLVTIDSSRYEYYTFRSPDHKLFGLTSKERRHRNNITKELISPMEYQELRKKYCFPLSDYGKTPDQIRAEVKQIHENRKQLYEENKDYFDTYYPNIDPKKIDLVEFVSDFDVVFIGCCAHPKDLLEIEISPITFLNYIAFSYDNKYVGIVGKPGSYGYIHVAKINYNESLETLTLEEDDFTKISDIQMATWFCSFNKLGTFAAYDSTPITYTFLPGETNPIKREGRSLLCMSKSGKYIALSTHSYDAISLGGSGHQPSTYVEIVSGDNPEEIKESFNCSEDVDTYSHSDPYKKNVVMAAFTNDDKKLMILRKDHVIFIRFIE